MHEEGTCFVLPIKGFKWSIQIFSSISHAIIRALWNQSDLIRHHSLPWMGKAIRSRVGPRLVVIYFGEMELHFNTPSLPLHLKPFGSFLQANRISPVGGILRPWDGSIKSSSNNWLTEKDLENILLDLFPILLELFLHVKSTWMKALMPMKL